MSNDYDLARFTRDGYIIVPSVFSSDKIDEVKASLLSEASSYIDDGDISRDIGSPILPFEAAAYLEARSLIFSDAVLSIVRQLLGCKPIYFGDSGIQFGSGYTGWHRDNRVSDRSDGATDDWKGDYDLIRIGIYLQDCAHHSGGLLIRAGSHKDAPRVPDWIRSSRLRKVLSRVHALRSRFHGRAKFVDTRKGDVVFWSLRAIHAGHAVRLKGAPRILLDPKWQPLVPDWRRVPTDGMRMAVFATFARRGTHYDRYRKYIVGRDYFANRARTAIDDYIPATIEFDKIN